MKYSLFIVLLTFVSLVAPATSASAATSDGKRKIVIIAGKPSHPPRMHEFRAGSLLLQKSLANVPGLVVEVADNGWVKDEKTFDDADAVVIYADGGRGNPAIQKDHAATLQRLADKGVGIAFMHYGVEIPAADPAKSAEFYSTVFGWNVRKRGDGATAFDDATGYVSGAFVLKRPPSGSPGLLVYVMVDDAAATIEKINTAGGEIVQPVGCDPGETTARFRDPCGNVLGIYQEPTKG